MSNCRGRLARYGAGLENLFPQGSEGSNPSPGALILNLILRRFRINEKNTKSFVYVLSILIFLFSLLYLIYFVKYENNVKYYLVSQVNPSLLGNKIGVCGVISSLYNYKGYWFLTLTDHTSEINVVDFRRQHPNYTKGEFLCVEGIVKTYKGELEIVIS